MIGPKWARLALVDFRTLRPGAQAYDYEFWDVVAEGWSRAYLAEEVALGASAALYGAGADHAIEFALAGYIAEQVFFVKRSPYGRRDVLARLLQRAKCREARDWAGADAIRRDLARFYRIEDVKWRQ
jgi:cysteinyl-tRNA synthetase